MHDSTDPPLLSVAGLRKRYGTSKQGYHVLDGVDFEVRRGETLGVVGESGCGKSTLARAVMRLGDGTDGSIVFDGADLGSLRGTALRRFRRRLQMVFQDPFGSLDPAMTILQIVEQPLRTHGVGTAVERRAAAVAVLEQLGLDARFLDRRPARLSGGQRQRVAIARALVLRPDLLVLDEAVSALDVSVQAQVLNLLADEQQRLGLAYLFIVHDLAVAEYFCDRILVLYLGRVVESGTARDLFEHPQHPYTVSLFSAAPDPARALEQRQRIVLGGEPQARRPAEGCPFAPRCPIGAGREICRTTTPATAAFDDGGHQAACHFPGELTLAGSSEQVA